MTICFQHLILLCIRLSVPLPLGNSLLGERRPSAPPSPCTASAQAAAHQKQWRRQQASRYTELEVTLEKVERQGRYVFHATLGLSL